MNKANQYIICERCVMDTTDPSITFDELGVCNYCRQYDANKSLFLPTGPDEAKNRLERLFSRIYKLSRGKRYHCVVGLSGGLDSSYLVWKAKELGLNPLVVHMDNGWNSELAVTNIDKLVSGMSLDLHTYVVDWREFFDLQLAYLNASVLDIEVVTDQAITAALYNVAQKFGLKVILGGTNFTTESIMPPLWSYEKNDCTNLKAIHRMFGKVPLKTYPVQGILKFMFKAGIQRIQTYHLLNLLNYNKKDAANILNRNFQWQDFGGKHYESIFTKFYQAYILPTKFGIDKRKPHLSTLVCSEQLTRSEALTELQKPLYTPEDFSKDRDYVLKKLELSPSQFDAIMKTPPKSHLSYPNDMNLRRLLLKTVILYRRLIKYPLRRLLQYFKKRRV